MKGEVREQIRTWACEGAAGPVYEGFREELLGQGYSWGSAAHQIHLMAHVSRWLEARGLGRQRWMST